MSIHNSDHGYAREVAERIYAGEIFLNGEGNNRAAFQVLNDGQAHELDDVVTVLHEHGVIRGPAKVAQFHARNMLGFRTGEYEKSKLVRDPEAHNSGFRVKSYYSHPLFGGMP